MTVDEKHCLVLTSDMGFGHRSAANAVAAALQESYPGACQVDIVNPLENEHVPPLMRSTDAYDKIVTELPKLYQFGYQASGAAVPNTVIESVLTLALYEAMMDVLQRTRPDVIISTYPYYQAPLGAVCTIGRRCIPLLTVVTDLVTVHPVWFHRASDLTLVPTDTARQLAIQAGLKPDRIHITGIPVHPKFSHQEGTPQSIRADMGWHPDLVTVLAVGSKRSRHMSAALHALNHSGLPIQIVLVAGGDNELFHRSEKTQWHVPAYLYNFVDDLPRMMRAADCILCKAGGLIVTESLACGLPLLLIDVLPGQEVGNASFVITGGAGEMAKNDMEVLEILSHWLLQDGELLARRAENSRRLGKPHAAYEVAELAWAAAEGRHGNPAALKIPGRTRLINMLKRYGIGKGSLTGK